MMQEVPQNQQPDFAQEDYGGDQADEELQVDYDQEQLDEDQQGGEIGHLGEEDQEIVGDKHANHAISTGDNEGAELEKDNDETLDKSAKGVENYDGNDNNNDDDADDGNEFDPTTAPPHGSEVFIGGIPRHATEEQIKEFCQQGLGEVYEVDLPMEGQEGVNYGFCHVVYNTQEQAYLAIEKLNQQPFPGSDSKVNVTAAQKSCKLHLGNIPRHIKSSELKDKLQELVKGVVNVEMLANKENPLENRGFVFVEFYNRQCAMLAKDKLTDLQIEGKVIQVSQAAPKRPADRTNPGYLMGTGQQYASGERAATVYVGNLPHQITEEKIKPLFSKFGEVERVQLPHEHMQHRGYGFIHFKEYAAAKAAIDEYSANPPTVDGNVLKVNKTFDRDRSQGYSQGGRGRGRVGYGYGSYQYGGRGGYNPGRGMGRGYGRSGYDYQGGHGYDMHQMQYPAYDAAGYEGYEDYMYDDGMGGMDDYYSQYYGYGGMMMPMMPSMSYQSMLMPGQPSSRASQGAGAMRRGGGGGDGGSQGSGASRGRGSGRAGSAGGRGGAGASRYQPYPY